MTKRKPLTIIDLMNRRNLLGPEFSGGSWDAWRAFLKTVFYLEMTDADDELYAKCTGRPGGDVPVGGFKEVFLCVGRRGGKSFVMALIAVYMACFRSWEKNLSAGEVATIMIVATDRAQARTILRYVIGLLHGVPALKDRIENERAGGVDLVGRVNIEVTTCNFRSIRGRTVVLAICEEIAFWRTDDSANPDSELLQALRPAMATTPGAMLLCVSSPYARRGELWRAYREFHAKPDAEVLFWKADTRTMNPTLPQSVVDRAYERDPDAAAAEYGAEFRTDIADFVSREAVEACVTLGCHERPYVSRTRYFAFTDPSGGASDSFTVVVAHREKDRVIQDAVREFRPPFSPDATCAEIAGFLKTYKLRTVTGDRYSGEWVVEGFRKHGIRYVASKKTKSELYVDVLAIINSGRADLLDHPKTVNQFCSLERRTSRQGRDSIDHPPGGHDDLCNAVAGVLVACEKPAFRPHAIRIKMFATPLDYL